MFRPMHRIVRKSNFDKTRCNKILQICRINRAHCNLMAEMEDPDQACFMGTHEIHGKYTKTRVYKRVKLYL